ALNLRGHHGSKPVDDIGRVPFADYLDDARAVAASIGDPIIVGHSMGGLLAQKLAELGDPPAVVALTPAAPRGIFPLCTLELLRVSLVHLHEFLLGRPIHPTPAEADALLFGRIPVAERRTAFERLVPESGRMAFDVAGVGETEYSRASNRTTRAMAVEAVRHAILDAGLTARDVDGMLDYQGGDSTLANHVAPDLGIRLNFYMDVMGGGSSTEALIGLAMGAI